MESIFAMAASYSFIFLNVTDLAMPCDRDLSQPHRDSAWEYGAEELFGIFTLQMRNASHLFSAKRNQHHKLHTPTKKLRKVHQKEKTGAISKRKGDLFCVFQSHVFFFFCRGFYLLAKSRESGEIGGVPCWDLKLNNLNSQCLGFFEAGISI